MKIILTALIIIFSIAAEAKLIKLSEQNKPLPNSAKNWACVVDTDSNLIWQVKNDPIDAKSTYTWFDGHSGVENGAYSKHCFAKENCNTQVYIAFLNKKTLCSKNNWRLPRAKELRSLLVFKDENPLINTYFFPYTQSKPYWSADSSRTNPEIAIDIPFFYGGTSGSDKSFDSYIRVVADE